MRRTEVAGKAVVLAMALVVLASVLASLGRPIPVAADLEDGHTLAYPRDEFPQPPPEPEERRERQLEKGQITRNLVDGKSLDVCSDIFPKATEDAVGRWNRALSREVLTFKGDLSECERTSSSAGWDAPDGVDAVFVTVGVTTTKTSFRGAILTHKECEKAYACVRQDHVEADGGVWRTRYGRVEVITNPKRFCHDVGLQPISIPIPFPTRPVCNVTQSDDDIRLLLTHELGHALSLGDYFCNHRDSKNPNNLTNKHPDFVDPNDSDMQTVMNSFLLWRRACNPSSGEPTDRDVSDYTTIYTPAAVVVDDKPRVDGRTVTLEWDQSKVFVESEFEIQRKVGETWLVLATEPPNEKSATLTNQPGGVQRYRIVARTMALPAEQRHGHAHGPESNVVEAAIQLATPTNVRATSRGANRLTLAWTRVSNASRYQLRRIAPSASCDGAVQNATIRTSQTFHRLEANTQYRLCVRAVFDTNAAIASEWASALATTKTQQLAAPGSPTAGSATTSTLTLSWSAVADDDLGEYEVMRSGSSTMWKVDAEDTSYRFTGLSTYTSYTLSVRALPKADSGRTASKWTSPVSARTSRPPRDASYSYSVVVTSPTRNRVVFGPNLSCFVVTEARRRTDIYWVSYYWDSTAVDWLPRTSLLQQGTWGDWYEVSRVLCMFGRSASDSWIVGAGVYELVWPEQSVQFTVPADATVELNWRKRESGEDTAVFSVAGGAELVVTPDQLSGDAVSGLAAPSDPTLSAIAASLRLVDADTDSADAGAVGGASEEGCSIASKPESGATNVDLAGGVCVIVEGGGEVRVTDSTQTLTLTLTSGRDWAVLAEPYSADNDDDAFWLIDLTTGGWLALNPADAAELARHAPADADGLPALLDAIAVSASPPATE